MLSYMRCVPKLRKRLIDHVKELLKDEVAASYFTPRQVIQIRETLRDDILTIGFARRFATYKRAHLLFRNLERWMKSSITQTSGAVYLCRESPSCR